jgi:hypothetical protein
MEHIPSRQGNSRLVSQKIPRLWWSPKIHRCVHNNRPPVRTQSHTTQLPYSPNLFPKICINIIFPSATNSTN